MRCITCMVLIGGVLLGGCSSGDWAVPRQPPAGKTAVVYEIQSAGIDGGWVWRADATGAHPVRLTRGQSPAVAPDGRLIAFARYQATPTTWSVWVSDLNGQSQRQVFSTRGDYAHGIGAITWSPDSSTLAVTDDQGITVIGLDGQTTRTLPNTRLAGQPSFSPDSTRIAFQDGASGRIMIASLAGFGASAITSGPNDLDPVWGPDGIAFSRSRFGDVWLVRPDGQGLRQLTHTNSGIMPVAFSADGGRLLADNPATHNGRIWVVDTRTGASRDLTGWVGDLFAQGISRDGTTILAALGCGGTSSVNGIVEVIPTSGGNPRTILTGPCRASWNA